eukprot:5312385-Prymnesium_polylepis.1
MQHKRIERHAVAQLLLALCGGHHPDWFDLLVACAADCNIVAASLAGSESTIACLSRATTANATQV